MAIKAVLFDLDGTLLPMDLDEFIKVYFKALAAYLAPHGYDAKQLIGGVWQGTEAMLKNDGSRTNEQAFWDTFACVMGEGVRADEPLLERFYTERFGDLRAICGFDDQAAGAVAHIRGSGLRVALATNPIFPAVATRQRVQWAGLQPEDFELVTTYENSRFSKPSDGYYRDIAQALGLEPSQCLMVGNDVDDDLSAERVGMQVFLLTPCLINKGQKPIGHYPQGGFAQLLAYIEENM